MSHQSPHVLTSIIKKKQEQDDGQNKIYAQGKCLYLATLELHAAGGGSSLRKDDDKEYTTMQQYSGWYEKLRTC
jgi:hypothetical protein